MQSNYLKKNKSNKTKKLVGRGGTRGKTAGRGTKGQKARAGHRIRPHIRDQIKKLPKLRGRGKNINKAFRVKAVAVNLGLLEKVFVAGARVSPGILLVKGLIAREKGVIPMVKILSNGEITKALSFKECLVSEAAKKKILAVGGTVN